MELCIPDVVARGSTHHDEGNWRAWIIHIVLEESSRKRYVRSRFSAVQMSVRKTFPRLQTGSLVVVVHFPQSFPVQPHYTFTVYRVAQIRDRANMREPAAICSILFRDNALEYLHITRIATAKRVLTIFFSGNYFSWQIFYN